MKATWDLMKIPRSISQCKSIFLAYLIAKSLTNSVATNYNSSYFAFYKIYSSGATRVSFRGNTLGGRPNRMFGAEPPRRQRIFENLQKFCKKIAKITLFCPIFQKVANPVLIFRGFARKIQVAAGNFWENFENFWWKLNRKMNFNIFWVGCCQK